MTAAGGLSEEFLQALEEKHTYKRRDARPTSADAAEVALPNSGTRRRQVYDFIAAAGERGATDDEIVAGIPMPANTVRPRRLELLESKLIKDSGDRRPTLYNQPAIVWVAV